MCGGYICHSLFFPEEMRDPPIAESVQWAIPELVLLIASHVTTSDLFSLIMCSKSFRQLVQPLLFHHLDISLDQIPCIAAAARKDPQLAGQVRSLCIKDLTTTYNSNVHDILGMRSEEDDGVFTETIAADLEFLLLEMSRSDALPGLQSFRWDLGPYDRPGIGVPEEVWHALAANAQSLRDIYVVLSVVDGISSVRHRWIQP